MIDRCATWLSPRLRLGFRVLNTFTHISQGPTLQKPAREQGRYTMRSFDAHFPDLEFDIGNLESLGTYSGGIASLVFYVAWPSRRASPQCEASRAANSVL